MHEYLVFDTPRSVGRKLDALLRAEAAHRLDEPDRAYRYEIFDRRLRIFKFARDVYDKPQIAHDEFSARFLVVIEQSYRKLLFLLGCERRRQCFGSVYVVYAVGKRRKKFKKLI